MRTVIITSIAIFSLCVASLAQGISAEEIVRRSHLAFYYPGSDLKARVLMKLISRGGKERIRELTMLRKDYQEGGQQKYYIYFHQPADVKGTTFMVWKYVDRDDDRWLFIPALRLVRRIAANDKRSSFVGSDFTYEDVSGREPEEDQYSLLREERYADSDCFVIKSVPKNPRSADYSYKLSWIDKARFLPLREEYYNKRGELYKVFTADEVRRVQGFWTITKRTMKNVRSGHRTEVVFTSVEYDRGIEDEIFTERYLRTPPQKWIR